MDTERRSTAFGRQSRNTASWLGGRTQRIGNGAYPSVVPAEQLRTQDQFRHLPIQEQKRNDHVPVEVGIVIKDCWCYECNQDQRYTRMFLCPQCGNKRCPRATDHREACTDSNDPGQEGSRYGAFPGPNRRLFDFIESKDDS